MLTAPTVNADPILPEKGHHREATYLLSFNVTLQQDWSHSYFCLESNYVDFASIGRSVERRRENR